MAERERFSAGPAAALRPGQLAYLNVDGLPIALANVDGTIYAFGDSCRHQGGPLSAGVLRDHVVTCPWHFWSYEIKTGTMVQDPRVGVSKHEVRIDGGVILVRLTD